MGVEPVTAYVLISDRAEALIGDVMLALAALAALTASMLPRAPLGRVARWLWRRNVSEPVGTWAKHVVRETVEPMIAASRAEIMTASRGQHEQQNDKLDSIEGRIDSLESRAAVLESLRRPPTTRTRKDDA